MSTARVARSAFVLWVGLLLSGCASLSSEHAPLAGDDFEVQARVAVHYGDESATGRVAWRHQSQSDELIISNPLGQGIAELKRTQQSYSLRTAEGKEYTADDPETLTEEALGWRLPLIGLPQWIRGRVLAGASAEGEKADGRYSELRQLGWRIDYLAYDEALNLPTRLRLRRDDLDIRLAIEQWHLGL